MKKIFLFLLAFSCNQVFADLGAVSTATGGTGRGAVETVDGILLNPAFLNSFPTKNFSFNYSADQWAMTISDNGADSFFPAALQFVNQKNDFIETRKMGLTLALPRWKNISLGGTFSLVEYTDLVLPAVVGAGTDKQRHGTVDLGLTVAITRDLGLGLVANRVAAGQVPLADSLQVQQTMALGLCYTYENFVRFRLDAETGARNSTDKLIYMAGMENYINDWVVFRLGAKKNQIIAKEFVTTGLGFVGPQFGLHYAFSTDTVDNSDQKHLIDLAVPF